MRCPTYGVPGEVGRLLPGWPSVQTLLVAQLAGRLNGLAQRPRRRLTVEHVAHEDILQHRTLRLLVPGNKTVELLELHRVRSLATQLLNTRFCRLLGYGLLFSALHYAKCLSPSGCQSGSWHFSRFLIELFFNN
jgi:hypothetical protein